MDFIPEPGTLSRVTYAPLVASSRRSCQTTVVLFNTETQRLQRFSSRGSPCLCGYTLGLLPRTPTLLSPKVTHRPWTTVTDCRLRSGQLLGKERLMIDGGGWRIFPSPKVTHRPWTAATGCRPEGNCRLLRADAHKKKESTSMRLTPESGGYLLSRNSVPSAIASLTSLFGMGRGGTSLP